MSDDMDQREEDTPDEGCPFDFDHIVGMVDYIGEFAKRRYGVSISDDGKEMITRDVLSHYYSHINTYPAMVTGSDPYKFLAWVGVFMYEHLYDENNPELARHMLLCAIAALRFTLKKEGRNVPTWFAGQCVGMVESEYRGDGHLGIGRNGLYMAFKGISISEKIR